MPLTALSVPRTIEPPSAENRMGRVRYRIGQVVGQILPRSSREADSALAALLPPEQFALVLRLSPADRRHQLRVHRSLVAEGWTDSDLLTAALLHDIGKADSHGRAGTAHRVLKVLLESLAPGRLQRLAREDGGWLRHGLYLSLNHPTIGADLARRTGAGERACWLVAHHDDDRISGDPAHQALRVRDARA